MSTVAESSETATPESHPPTKSNPQPQSNQSNQSNGAPNRRAPPLSDTRDSISLSLFSFLFSFFSFLHHFHFHTNDSFNHHHTPPMAQHHTISHSISLLIRVVTSYLCILPPSGRSASS